MSAPAAIHDLREALSRRYPDALPLSWRTAQAVATVAGIVYFHLATITPPLRRRPPPARHAA